MDLHIELLLLYIIINIRLLLATNVIACIYIVTVINILSFSQSVKYCLYLAIYIWYITYRYSVNICLVNVPK